MIRSISSKQHFIHEQGEHITSDGQKKNSNDVVSFVGSFSESILASLPVTCNQVIAAIFR